MNRLATVEDIADLYAKRGGQTYGEDVTQLDHALQCAALAAASGAAPALIAAALLHDIGHLLHTVDSGGDADHAATGARSLATLFGPGVSGPVARHVAAKRYLCFAVSGYHAQLSRASVASLAEQGGAFDAAGAAAFFEGPHAAAAIALRRFDDMGKQDAVAVRPFAAYLPLLAALATP